MLCNLYKFYYETAKDSASQSPEISSVPVSPSVPYSDVSNPPATASVRRTGSFGSILDSPHSQGAVTVGRSGGGGGRSVFRRGHRRAHSGPNSNDGSDSPRDTRANTIAVPPGSSASHSRSKSSSISDPFDELETLWASLESWFDLLAIEVEKVQKQEESTSQEDSAVISNPKVSISEAPIETSVANGTANTDHKLPTGEEDKVNSKPKKKADLKLPSSELAAAIVKSTPVDRRAAFLKASVSFDTQSLPLFNLSEAAAKRRSWHVDRVTVRYLSVTGAQGVQSTLPEFGRSLSSDSTLSKYR